MKYRLKELRKNVLKLTQQEFADIIGVSKSTIEGYEYGRRDIPETTIKAICREFKINYDWLAYGDGQIKDTTSSDAQAIIDAVMTSDNEFIKSSLVKLASLDKKYWDMIEEIVKELKKDV